MVWVSLLNIPLIFIPLIFLGIYTLTPCHFRTYQPGDSQETDTWVYLWVSSIPRVGYMSGANEVYVYTYIINYTCFNGYYSDV